MTLARVGAEALQLRTCLSRPDTASLVVTRRDHLVALRVKTDLTDLGLVPLENGGAGSSEDIVDAGHTVGTGGGQLVACLVEAGIEHLVVVAAELFDALACAHVPKTRRPVYAASEAVVTSEVKLTA